MDRWRKGDLDASNSHTTFAPGTRSIGGWRRLDRPGEFDGLPMDLRHGLDRYRLALVVSRLPIHPVGGVSVTLDFKVLDKAPGCLSTLDESFHLDSRHGVALDRR